jgi:hypothetical protein
MARARCTNRRPWILPLAVWLLAAVYVGARLGHHWVPLDEGELGHAADRVLRGELPHRDFDDIWTGGLAEIHAALFRVVGASLLAMRLLLFAVFLAWVPAIFALARRVAPPTAAAVATALAVVWSLPNYVAAMPSWYVLFLATFGTLALCRFMETGARRWLIAAGAAGGAAITLKVIGLYFVAAAGLVLLYLEQESSGHPESAGHPEPSASRGARVYSVLITGVLLAFVVGVDRLASQVPSIDGAPRLQFVLPAALVAICLLRREWQRRPTCGFGVRLRALATLAWPVFVGVAVPLAIFLVPYVRTHAVSALLTGVLVDPQRRFRYAAVAPPGFDTILPALAWLAILVPLEIRRPRIAGAVFTLLLVALLILAWWGGAPYAAIWSAIGHAPWCIAAAGVLTVWRAGVEPRARAMLFLLVAVTAMCGLVRIPYAETAYTFYFAPLEILTVLAIVRLRPEGAGPFVAPVAAFLVVLGVGLVNPWRFTAEGDRLRPPLEVPFAVARTGLTVPIRDAAAYETVVRLVATHVPAGAALYAGPDCPEIFFLTQRRNPTPTILDFLDDPARHDAIVLGAIADPTVGGAVIYRTPHQSPPIDSVVARAVRTRFPDSAVAGPFTVRWAPPAP